MPEQELPEQGSDHAGLGDAGQVDHAPTPQPDSPRTTRREFVAAFTALGLVHFTLLVPGAAGARAQHGGTYSCGQELPNGQWAKDVLCSVQYPSGAFKADLNCGNPASTASGFDKDEDCGKSVNGGTDPIVQQDDDCGIANTSTGNSAEDGDCGKPDVNGLSHQDDRCNTPSSAGSTDLHGDSDCSPTSHDSDCSTITVLPEHSGDQDCIASIIESDGDCTTGGSDDDCGIQTGAFSNDEDCTAPGSSDDDCGQTSGVPHFAPDEGCTASGNDEDCDLPQYPAGLHEDGP